LSHIKTLKTTQNVSIISWSSSGGLFDSS
jgi:hypothetical protein